MACKLCNHGTALPYIKYSNYNFCPFCNFYFQKELPPKLFEGPNENNGKGPGTGHLMSSDEKEINKNLANALYDIIIPRTVLQIHGCGRELCIC